MDELAEWLRKQLDTDAARAGQWHDLECEIHQHLDAGLLAAVAATRMLEEVPGAVCDCGGPQRMLAEIESRRSIVTLYEKASAEAVRLAKIGEDCEEWVQTAGLLQLCVGHLAAAHQDRPGFQESWRP